MLLLLSFFSLSLAGGKRPSTPQPPPTASPDDISLLSEFAQFASATYCPASSINQWNCQRCLYNYVSHVQTFQAGDQFGYFAINNKENAIMIVFRATQGISQWINNLKTDNTRYKNYKDSFIDSSSKVHTGFQNMWSKVKNQVATLLKDYVERFPGLYILCIGHSLGGIFASFASILAKELFPALHTVLRTFGEPRLMNPSMSAYYQTLNIDAKRFTNHGDLIPHLPIEDRFLHHQEEVCKFNNLHYYCGSPFDDRTNPSMYCSNSNNWPSNYLGILWHVFWDTYKLEETHGRYFGVDMRDKC